MITTHGYSLNQINLWNTTDNWEEKSVNKVVTLTGHTYRVLYLSVSPSGESILTGAGDETLRFWNVFDSGQYQKEGKLQFQVDLRWTIDIRVFNFKLIIHWRTFNFPWVKGNNLIKKIAATFANKIICMLNVGDMWNRSINLIVTFIYNSRKLIFQLRQCWW